MTDPRPSDLATLADRLGLLQVARVAIGVMVAAGAFWAPDWLGASAARVLPLTLIYIGGTTAVEVGRRTCGWDSVAIVSGSLLADGVFLAVVSALGHRSGGLTVSLIELHVIAVALLVSYRNGLKIALWHVLLLFIVSVSKEAALSSTAAAVARRTAVFDAVVVLLVAVGTAAASSLNERQLRRVNAEQSALASLARRLQTAQKVTDVVDALVDEIVPALGFQRGAVEVNVDGGVLQQAALRRVPLLVRSFDPEADWRLASRLPDATNVVVVPLIADGDPAGGLALEWGHGPSARIPGRTVEIAARFADHAALALRNVALLAEIERMARTDGLTGLSNRREFDRVLQRELNRAIRNDATCALVVLDIDHFKQVNDVHGHQAGDEVLRDVGAVLGASCRDIDIAARYGGEEFALVLPGCRGRDAAQITERVREAVAEAGLIVPVTISAGVAVFPANATDPSGLVAAADEALYRAKRTGRDRVVVSRRRPTRPDQDAAAAADAAGADELAS